MDLTFALLTIIGLVIFESITSIDNAIINAEVLTGMKPWARRWFLTWGIGFAVFGIRGLLPWFIVWFMAPGLGPLQAFTATLTGDEAALKAIQQSAPVLLLGGVPFLFFSFLTGSFSNLRNMVCRVRDSLRARAPGFTP